MRDSGKEDLRVIKTRAAIHAAFTGLAGEKDFAAVTVKDICERAMINKKTFYCHYLNLEALLAATLESLSAGFAQQVRTEGLAPGDVAAAFLAFAARQGDAYARLLAGASAGLGSKLALPALERALEATPEARRLPEAERALAVAAWVAVCTGLFRQWAQSGRAVPADKLARLARALVMQGAGGL